MHPAQHTMAAIRPGQDAPLRILLVAVVAVAIVEVVVIGYLVLRPVAAVAAVAVAPSHDVTLAEDRLVGFRDGERVSIAAPTSSIEDFLVQHRAAERSSLIPLAAGASAGDDWVVDFRTGEREPLAASVGGADEWQRRFRATERTGG